MPLELTLSILAVSGALLAAISYRFWPHIAVRSYREKHPGFGVREIAVQVWRPRLARLPLAESGGPARFEFVVYFTVKSCNP